MRDLADNKVITIATYSNITEAYIYKNILDMEGIENYVSDANAVLTPSVPAPHDGGVKIAVKESDAARAISALNKAQQER